MKHKSETTSQINEQRKTLGEKLAGKFYEVSRRPNDRHKTLLAVKGTRLRTPSGTSVPPAWTDVWITTDVKSRIQATGRDSMGRRVYLYSTEYMGRTSAAKFSRLKAFGKVYPSLIKKVRRDMKTSEEALVLYLISKTGFRIGNKSETLSRVKAFGASTLRCSHVKVEGNKLSFDFTGKKGIRNNKVLRDKFLANDMSGRCAGGADKNIFNATADEVRSYLNSIPGGSNFMVKDFRTYLGTLAALRKIKTMPVPKNKTEFKRLRRAVGQTVADKLGNSPTIALKSYVSPEVFAAWECCQASFEGKARGKLYSLANEFLECVCYDQAVPMEECRDADPLEQLG